MSVSLQKRNHATDVGRTGYGRDVTHAIRGGTWRHIGTNRARCGRKLTRRESYFSDRQIRVTCGNCLRTVA